MKVNKIGIIIGLLIVCSMFAFILNIDSEVMCESPKLSDTVTYVNISNVIIVDDYEICRWVNDNEYKENKIKIIMENVF